MSMQYDGAPCYFFSCAEDGALIHVNDTLRERLGYGPDELAGKKVETLFTLPTRIFQETHFSPLLRMHGHAEEIFISLQTKAREYVHVLINATRQETAGDVIILYAGIEVQARKKFEDELVAARKAAEKALQENTELIRARQELQDHLEALDHQISVAGKQHQELVQFNKVITHDLREPLRKLSVFANMLLDSADARPPAGIVERLLSVSDRMRAIVSGLQQYIWLTETELRPAAIDPGTILLAARDMLQREHPSIRLEIDMDALPTVYADAEQLKVMFYQLLSNAIRFRKEGEYAGVKLTATSLQKNSFRHLAGKYKYTGFVRLELADRGVGFNNDYKAQVFDLFRHLHPQSGTGIGLALCRKIAELHHGSIDINGREGEGAVVTILLPDSASDTSGRPGPELPAA